MRMSRCTGIIVGIALLSGCYTYEPTGAATPEIGQEFAFDINDVGRVALGGSMGPEIAQIEGRLISRENAEYLVAVTSVHFLRGGEQVWKGENVRIKSEFVTSTYERHFSKGRSITLGAAAVGAATYLLTRSLFGSGSEGVATPPNGGTSLRVP
jgi:hypothetical protein